MAARETEQEWFLSPSERGNPDTEIDSIASSGRSWTEGNLVEPLIDGASYFLRLLFELEALEPGDSVWFTEWECARDELLSPHGPTVGNLLASLAARGVDVRGLVWRSRPQSLSFSSVANGRLEAEINRQGGQVLLDQRVLPFGSHHQKLVLVRHPGRPQADVAFVGGVDICHARRDDQEHAGDPQPGTMDPRYGAQPAWHDIQLEVRGPAVAQLEWCFRERWSDPSQLGLPTPLRAVVARLSAEPKSLSPLPEALPPPAPAGSHLVQVLRTYPRRRRPYPFAGTGEFSVARALIKAIGRAERLIYIEEQYLWSRETAEPLARRLAARPDLHLIMLLPRWPHSDGALSGPPGRLGQLAALDRLYQAGPGRVAVYDLENPAGRPTYVHAKVCIVDDVWAVVGSANINLRSWTHDSELSLAVLGGDQEGRDPEGPSDPGDGAAVFARSLRLRLWSEHLGRSTRDPALLDLLAAPQLWRESAEELALWRRDGAQGPHPPARVSPHLCAPVRRRSRWWAKLVYRYVYDPDNHGRGQRRGGQF